ncbi:C4-dicarboxylate ABC transporter substrate-binding protein [Betaproteobacteria bacterium]|nr:C4-dicarboxylate ABC transporter substrate-binding protein [Betaproteobacteria bacterium]
MKTRFLRVILSGAVTALAFCTQAAFAQAAITMHGATQFNDDHDYNRTLKYFGEQVSKHYGKPVEVIVHGNSELGVERDYTKFMNQGISVDVAILAGGNMSNFSQAAGLLDLPFLFRDKAHWTKAVTGTGLKALYDKVEKDAGVIVLGTCAGSTRNLVAVKPMRNMQELAGYKMRIQGAPIQAKIFGAWGIKPSVIAFNEVYNAIQSGVIEGLENETPPILNMKFYEVAPEISMTRHIVVSRLLAFSAKTFNKYPPELQAAIRKAGEEAAAYNREIQTREEKEMLQQMLDEKKIRTHEFTDQAKLFELTKPFVQEWAKEIGIEKILADIQAIQ